MKKKLIYFGIASILAIGIYSLISTPYVELLKDNLKAMADESVKIPCNTGGTGCKFEVETTETEESESETGTVTIKELKNAK